MLRQKSQFVVFNPKLFSSNFYYSNNYVAVGVIIDFFALVTNGKLSLVMLSTMPEHESLD
jgi:hypothetical protein